MADIVTLAKIFVLPREDLAKILSTQGRSLSPKDEKDLINDSKILNGDRALAAIIYYNARMITLREDKDIIKNPNFFTVMSSVTSLQEGLLRLGVKQPSVEVKTVDEPFIMSRLLPDLQGVVANFFSPVEAFVYNIVNPNTELAKLSKGITAEKAIVSTVETGWVEGMEFLLKTAADETKLKLASKAFIVAAGVENVDLMKRLHEEYKLDNPTLITAIHKAVSNGKILSSTWLMSKTPLDEIELNILLGVAARNGHLHLVQFLIVRGAKDWPAAFNNAVKGGHIPIMEWLVTSGKISTYDKYGVLRRGIIAKQIPVLDWVVSKGVYRDAFDGVLYEASLRGNIPIMEWAINKGARNINELLANAHEFTPEVVAWLRSKV